MVFCVRVVRIPIAFVVSRRGLHSEVDKARDKVEAPYPGKPVAIEHLGLGIYVLEGSGIARMIYVINDHDFANKGGDGVVK
jgi:hypothetical protein